MEIACNLKGKKKEKKIMYIAQKKKYGVVIILRRVTNDDEILSIALLESDFVFSRGRRLR